VSFSACDDCLRRTALIAALASRLDLEWRRRSAPAGVLSLPDDELVALDHSGYVARAQAGFSAARARERIRAAGLTAVCRCSGEYPERLRELADPPAVLHIAGCPEALEREDSVAIVGARRGTGYGLEVARSLGRRLAAAGVPVVSGMAMGVDSAAHIGALERAAAEPRFGQSHGLRPAAGPAAEVAVTGPAHPGSTQPNRGPGAAARETDLPSPRPNEPHRTRRPAAPIAVLAGGADVAYPPSRRGLHAQLIEHGCVVSELPPGFTAFRWCFVARNRLIAGLAALTVVVEATERSGSLTTADFAEQLGRPVCAVPGPVTSRFSAGTNALLAAGAGLVRDVHDVLDQLLGPGAPRLDDAPPAVPLEPRLRRLLDAIERGHGSLAELTSDPAATRQVLQDLTDLELRGLVRREFGGRYVRALEAR
jgi:DNA processing protein